ncbi:hypothetical protein AB7M38_003992 [Bradyrhizobium diazoefficiens]
MGTVAPHHPGRDRRRQQRRRPVRYGIEIAGAGTNAGGARERNLQQEEALEAAGIDADRSAIGNVVDGKAVERRAIVPGGEAGRPRLRRLEIVRTEDASNLLGRLIDIIGGDAGKVRKPFCCGRTCAHFQHGCGHRRPRFASRNCFKPIIVPWTRKGPRRKIVVLHGKSSIRIRLADRQAAGRWPKLHPRRNP